MADQPYKRLAYDMAMFRQSIAEDVEMRIRQFQEASGVNVTLVELSALKSGIDLKIEVDAKLAI